MTEEIIIDGVNIVGCEYMLNNKIKGKQHCPAKAMPYAKETSCICRKSIDTPYNFCKHNPNCHYKQLKRLEQERDEYKECFISTDINAKKIQTKLFEKEELCKKLEQENKRLKERQINWYNAEAQKYHSALEEIKNNFMCFRGCMIPFHIGNKESLPHKMADAIQSYCESIINKINEVLQCE